MADTITSPDELPEPIDHDGLQHRADSLNDAGRESPADAARWEQIKRDFLANTAPIRCGAQRDPSAMSVFDLLDGITAAAKRIERGAA